MRRTILGRSLAVVTLVGWLVTPALAQDTKSARGNVTAMTGDSITVKAGDRELKFAVDAKTVLTASGAGTASRQAEAAGKPGPKLADFVKVGDAVEVNYREAGGTMTAANIRRIQSAGSGGGDHLRRAFGVGEWHRGIDHGIDADDHRYGERRHLQAIVHHRRYDQGGRGWCRHRGIGGRRQGLDYRYRRGRRSGHRDVSQDWIDATRRRSARACEEKVGNVGARPNMSWGARLNLTSVAASRPAQDLAAVPVAGLPATPAPGRAAPQGC